jgi:enolase-phosphatase E1
MAAPFARPRVVLTDIEGTTSSISFVKDVLFPYARERLPAFVAANSGRPEVRALLDDAAREGGIAGAGDDAIVALLQRWIDEDRKATPLKALQGMVWFDGYDGRHFVAHMYPDATAALRRWHAAGIPLHVYSSGSVPAQKLYFGHTADGDLLPLFTGFFDTTSGPKREADSYRRIVAAIGVPAPDILFLSDIDAELDAAAEAGLATAWVRRDGTPAPHQRHRAITRFDELGF